MQCIRTRFILFCIVGTTFCTSDAFAKRGWAELPERHLMPSFCGISATKPKNVSNGSTTDSEIDQRDWQQLYYRAWSGSLSIGILSICGRRPEARAHVTNQDFALMEAEARFWGEYKTALARFKKAA